MIRTSILNRFHFEQLIAPEATEFMAQWRRLPRHSLPFLSAQRLIDLLSAQGLIDLGVEAAGSARALTRQRCS
jgi:hypothetical protein